MSYPPRPAAVIVIAGKKLEGWTSMRLTRAKKDATGSLTVTIFFGFVPNTPQMTGAAAGKQVQVYIGNHLAFTGSLDKREGGGKKGKGGSKGGGARAVGGQFMPGGGEPGISSSIGPNDYRITLTARGKMKDVVDSSHTHKTGSIKKAKTRNVVEEVLKPFKVALDWRAPSLDMGIVRLRDGNIALDEIDRVSNEYGLFRWETRDGKLRVTDKAGPETGEPLILGDNILEFNATQSEDQAHSQIKVKGQRTDKNTWGKDAVNRIKTIRDSITQRHRPITLQHYTDATDEALERRGRHEANVRNSKCKDIRVTVFHVMPRTGAPWDIGNLHYVEVPPEGIFDVFECTGITYTIDGNNMKTELTLNPPPSGAKAGGGGASLAGAPGGLPGLAGVTGALSTATAAIRDLASIGVARRIQAGISLVAGSYPAPWTGPDLTYVNEAVTDTIQTALVTQPQDDVPLTLPDHLRDPQ